MQGERRLRACVLGFQFIGFGRLSDRPLKPINPQPTTTAVNALSITHFN